MIFVNCTHHPAHNWQADQYESAKRFGTVIDVPFPSVSPTATSEDVHRMACDLLDSFEELAVKHDGATVHLMGEHSLCMALAREYERRLWQEDAGALTTAPFRRDKLRFVVTASRRMSHVEDGQRKYDWQFVGFREVP